MGTRPTRASGFLSRFFTTPRGPFNLAVFRILFFLSAALFVPALSTVRRYSQLPKALEFAPPPWQFLTPHLPLSPTTVTIAYVALVAAGICAVVGYRARLACWTFAVAGSYYLGVPELFGKVEHYQHLIWIPAILGCSRCADALALDSARDAVRRARRGDSSPPHASLAYALPLRFIWLSMGLAYLWPGVHKLWDVGLAWTSPSHLRLIMYSMWYENGPPAIRYDHSAILLRATGVATILFECSFIALVLFRWGRVVALVTGTAFHILTRLALRISWSVFSLLAAYPSLIDWERLSARVFAATGRGQLSVEIDPACPRCREAVAVLRALALPGAVRFRELPDGEAWALLLPATGARALAGESRISGLLAFRRVAWRVPVLWPALPLLYLPPLQPMCRRLWRDFLNRTARSYTGAREISRSRTARLWPTLIGGGAIVLAMLGAGPLNLEEGWPIASYPSFAGVYRLTEDIIVFREDPRGALGGETTLERALPWMGGDRAAGLEQSLFALRPGPDQRRRLSALVRVADIPRPPRATIDVLGATVSDVPGHRGEILRQKLLLRSGT